MCNRYRLSVKQRELAIRYGIEPEFAADETYEPGKLEELFPDRPARGVRGEEYRRVLDTMRWGFPHEVPGTSVRMLKKSATNVRNLASP